jgi:8-oxo-dGTP pyrophosphatase MutT (NUDIX family)
MPSSRCCGTSVGVLIRDGAGRLLMITRGWHPVGVAPVAGHVADAHDDAAGAVVAEVSEEVGLSVTSHRIVWEGWLPNLCASPPAFPVPGHRWSVAVATVSGELSPDPVETRGASWYDDGQVEELAARTLRWGRGWVTDIEAQAVPPLEPVWVELLHRTGVREATELEREVARRLYTTPPRTYWLDGRAVPASEVAQ